MTHSSIKKAFPRMINWLKTYGTKSSGVTYDSKGYLIPGIGQKVWRVSAMDISNYTYYSTLANGHHLIGQTYYRSYNVEVMPGTHSNSESFTNPSNGKHWVLYYLGDIYKTPWGSYAAAPHKNYKSLTGMDLQVSAHVPYGYFRSPAADKGSTLYSWNKKILLVNIKAAEQVDN